MDPDTLIVVTRLVLATSLGGLIGLERTFHGRPAGFRTHTLVCLASTLLMLLAVFQRKLLPAFFPPGMGPVDPMRIAQGIMTGIGFLGAGVIIKEKVSVRGLTTAASIWITSALGILIGAGFTFAAVTGAFLTLGILTLFRHLESVIPSLHYGSLSVGFLRDRVIPDEELFQVIRSHDIHATSPSYHMLEKGGVFQYQMTLQTKNVLNFRKLSETLSKMGSVHEFSIFLTSH